MPISAWWSCVVPRAKRVLKYVSFIPILFNVFQFSVRNSAMVLFPHIFQLIPCDWESIYYNWLQWLATVVSNVKLTSCRCYKLVVLARKQLGVGVTSNANATLCIIAPYDCLAYILCFQFDYRTSTLWKIWYETTARVGVSPSEFKVFVKIRRTFEHYM